MLGLLKFTQQNTRLQALALVNPLVILPVLSQHALLLLCNDSRQVSTTASSFSSQADSHRREHRRRSSHQLQWQVYVGFVKRLLIAKGTDRVSTYVYMYLTQLQLMPDTDDFCCEGARAAQQRVSTASDDHPRPAWTKPSRYLNIRGEQARENFRKGQHRAAQWCHTLSHRNCQEHCARRSSVALQVQVLCCLIPAGLFRSY